MPECQTLRARPPSVADVLGEPGEIWEIALHVTSWVMQGEIWESALQQ